MNKNQLIQSIKGLVTSWEEEKLLFGLDSLKEEELDQFYKQLKHAERLLPKENRKTLLNHTSSKKKIFPFKAIDKRTIFSVKEEEIDFCKQGKIGLVLLAGGQASRLECSFPKGMFPISPILNKTLFELFFEKIKAASLAYRIDVPVAVMVSSSNRKETENYFKEKEYFGLKQEKIFLFEQHSLPLLDLSCNFLLEKPGQLLEGPSGNGEVFHLLNNHQLLKFFEELGISSLEIFPIDNPLCFPLDGALAYQHHQNHTDVIFKAFERRSEQANVGLISLCDGKPFIAEYSEIDPSFIKKRNEDGTFHFSIANSGHLSFTLSFVKQIASIPFAPTYHIAKKMMKALDEQGISVEQNIYKLESFIFDHLHLAKSAFAFIFPEKEFFSPLKKKGDVAIVREDLSNLAKAILKNFYDVFSDEKELEISPELFYTKKGPRKIHFENPGVNF